MGSVDMGWSMEYECLRDEGDLNTGKGVGGVCDPPAKITPKNPWGTPGPKSKNRAPDMLIYTHIWPY